MNKEAVRERLKRHRTLVVVGGAGLFAVAIITMTWWFVQPGQNQRNEFVKSAAQIAGAIFLALGLYFTHRTVENSQETLEHQRKSQHETLEHQRKSQQDERFFKAAEMLGNKDSIDARIGALFTLEHLANESDSHYYQVIEVISTFVRRRSDDIRPDDYRIEGVALPKASHDIEVAFSILGRRRMSLGAGEIKGLNLRGAYLCELELKEGGEFEMADFARAVFTDATFTDFNFARASFEHAWLRKGTFINCIFILANFYEANAEEVTLLYMGAIDDPYTRIAIEATSGVPPNQVTTYSRELREMTPETPNYGRYLDHTTWISSRVEKLQILDMASLDLDQEQEPIDLSRMRHLRVEQYKLMVISSRAIPPQF